MTLPDAGGEVVKDCQNSWPLSIRERRAGSGRLTENQNGSGAMVGNAVALWQLTGHDLPAGLPDGDGALVPQGSHAGISAAAYPLRPGFLGT